MAKRFLILLWLPALAGIVYLDLLKAASSVLFLMGFAEVAERKPPNLWSNLAIGILTGVALLGWVPLAEAGFLAVVVIANDTAAYFGGQLGNFCSLMRRHIFPITSPKKTWGGTLYGLVAAGLASWFGARLLEVPPELSFKVGLVVAGLAILGDYLGSKFKRSHRIKDSGEGLFSGRLFPEHGGILDRFGALGAATVVWPFLRITLT